MNKEDIAARVFEILEGTNQGFFKAYAQVNNGTVNLFYQKKDET